MCDSEEATEDFLTLMVNRIALHICNGYCLRKKKIDSKCRYCRVYFGQEDPVTKKTPGKEVHPLTHRLLDQAIRDMSDQEIIWR